MDVPPEATTIARLRAGDAGAFAEVVTRYHPSMVRVAETFVPSRAVAEEVAEDTWIAVMRGIGTFEARSSLRTWIFRILVNRAQTTGVREHRSVPLSSLAGELADTEPSVPPDRFAGPPGHGAWSSPPDHWSNEAETAAMGNATFEVVARAAAALPEHQRRVLVLRDIEGWTSDEVCRLLELTEGNQRVLLHRARSKVRACARRGDGESVMRLFRRRTVICQEWVELVTDYLEGALPRTTAAIDRHLGACEHCHEYLAQMRVTIRLTGRLSDDQVPVEVRDALVQAFRELNS